MSTRESPPKAFLKIGFHTGGFNSAYVSFEKAVRWAEEHGVHGIECGFVGGVTWNHGLGYFPHLASWEDPKEIRRLLDRHKVELSQIDAAFPLSIPEGATLGVEYVMRTIRWAKLAGCPRVDTTDDRNRKTVVVDALKDLDRIALSDAVVHSQHTGRMHTATHLHVRWKRLSAHAPPV